MEKRMAVVSSTGDSEHQLLLPVGHSVAEEFGYLCVVSSGKEAYIEGTPLKVQLLEDRWVKHPITGVPPGLSVCTLVTFACNVCSA